MDLKDLPSCPLEARAALITWDASDRARLAVDYIKNRYPRYKIVTECIDFLNCDLRDCMRSDFETLERVWLFPGNEAADELSECLNRMLESSYKATRDNMRRALEMILVGAFFSQSRISPSDAQSWCNSTRETPFFARTVKDVATLQRFDRLELACKWTSRISEFYWGLCDTVHTKGHRHSLQALQPVHGCINSVRVPEFNDGALEQCLDLYVQTVEYIALILAAYNPVLLVGLPMYEKFGDNPPLSGFFEESQSGRLWRLIPRNYHSTFESIVASDEEVLSVREWMNGLPDKF